MIHPYQLYLVTDRPSLNNLSLTEVVVAAIKAGVTCVQLREKSLSTREFVALAKHLKQILTAYQVPLFINDRVDIALAANADGVHLGSTDMQYKDARKILGKNILIGLTINNINQIDEYNQYQVAYLGVSALFKSQVKHDIEHIWSESEIRELKKTSKHRLLGIGGINPSNTERVLSYGIDGIAVASAICAQPSCEAVEHQVQQFKMHMRRSWI